MSEPICAIGTWVPAEMPDGSPLSERCMAFGANTPGRECQMIVEFSEWPMTTGHPSIKVWVRFYEDEDWASIEGGHEKIPRFLEVLAPFMGIIALSVKEIGDMLAPIMEATQDAREAIAKLDPHMDLSLGLPNNPSEFERLTDD